MFDEYFKLQQEIHEHFGYQEDWVVIPLVDHREYYWRLNGGGQGSFVTYFEEPLTDEIIEDGEYYEAEIYTQRFLPKWVYHAKDYTLICMDTHTDGNKYLGIFDNGKECKQ